MMQMEKIRYISTVSLFFSFILTISSAHAQDRVAIIIQQYGDNADFQNTLYSGATEAAEAYGLILDVYDGRISTKTKAIKWFEETVLRKQPKAIIIVDTSFSGYTQIFLDQASRKNIMAGVLNADLNNLYFGADFRVGSEKAHEGKVAGEYLRRFQDTTPLCISYLSAARSDTLRCRGLANGLKKRIYQLNADISNEGIYEGVKQFLSYFPDNAKVIVTDQALLNPVFAVRTRTKKEGLGDFSIGFVGTGGSGMVKHLLNGQLEFIVNDQPYFQGYWAVSAVSLALTFKLEPQNLLASGPVVIDRNIAQKIDKGQKNISLELPQKRQQVTTTNKRPKAYPGIPPLRLRK